MHHLRKAGRKIHHNQGPPISDLPLCGSLWAHGLEQGSLPNNFLNHPGQCMIPVAPVIRKWQPRSHPVFQTSHLRPLRIANHHLCSNSHKNHHLYMTGTTRDYCLDLNWCIVHSANHGVGQANPQTNWWLNQTNISHKSSLLERHTWALTSLQSPKGSIFHRSNQSVQFWNKHSKCVTMIVKEFYSKSIHL